ncbi:putative immunity protein [Thermotoga profunda]|uniref:putative immunity protein n=1 Tax=Thermotoga profunda TaxID=1508420 RepID=UPI00059722D3|nr:hypothetical protein [Thermotoga profunda]
MRKVGDIKILFSDVDMRIKKGRKILFSRDSRCLQDLIGLIQLQKHKTLIMWSLDCAKTILEQFEAKYPNEQRPRICLEFCSKWAMGKIKMPVARQVILAVHELAKEIETKDREYSYLCRAIGHAGATVHTKKHALGLPIYELTALVLKYGKENFYEPIVQRIDNYYQRLLYWQKNIDNFDLEWANFLLRD